MQELINTLISKANIDEATAVKVIDVVKNFLEDKLPSPIDDQVSKVLDGVESDQINDGLNAVKGFFKK